MNPRPGQAEHPLFSDIGFWQNPYGSNSGVRAKIFSLPIHDPKPRHESKLHDEQHKGQKVYTSSGHRCGVIPYSSLWCGGLPQGLMMNSTKEEQPRERCTWAGAVNYLGEFDRLWI